jgi:hypothetical protein
MVLPLSNTAEGGTNGVAATVGNSGGGSGDAFNSVVGTVLYSNTEKAHGSLAYRLTQPASSQAKVAWTTTSIGSVTSGDVFTRHYVRFDANPSVNSLILQCRGAAANAYSIRRNTDGNVVLMDAASAIIYTGTVPLPNLGWIRVETRATISATVGRFLAKFFYDDGSGKDHHSTNEVFALGSESVNQNLRGTLDEVNFGFMTAATGNSCYVDGAVVQTTGWVGSAVPPAVEAADFYSADGLSSYHLVSIDGT